MIDEIEEVKFVCTICKHEFCGIEDYDTRIKVHEVISDREKDITELENMILYDILETFAVEDKVIHQTQVEKIEPQKEPSLSLKCNQCEFETDYDKSLMPYSNKTSTNKRKKS